MSKITVSDQFVEIYQNFTKENQVENMNKLTKEELYFLIINVVDNLDEDNPILKDNINYTKNIYDRMERGTAVKDKPITLKKQAHIVKLFGSPYMENNLSVEIDDFERDNDEIKSTVSLS